MYCLETLQERGNIGSIYHKKGNGDLKKMVGDYPPLTREGVHIELTDRKGHLASTQKLVDEHGTHYAFVAKVKHLDGSMRGKENLLAMSEHHYHWPQVL